MTRRRLLLVALLLLAVLVGVAAWLAAPTPTQITLENASRIQKGMTLGEVEALLGGPERDEMKHASWFWVTKPIGGIGTDGRAFEGPLWRTECSWKRPTVTESIPGQRTWISSRCSVEIIFDERDRVTQRDGVPVASKTEFGFFFLNK